MKANPPKRARETTAHAPGESVLWKPYGFRHILKKDTVTLCGNDFGFYFAERIQWGPFAKHRPLCGVCRRVQEARRRRVQEARKKRALCEESQ